MVASRLIVTELEACTDEVGGRLGGKPVVTQRVADCERCLEARPGSHEIACQVAEVSAEEALKRQHQGVVALGRNGGRLVEPRGSSLSGPAVEAEAQGQPELARVIHVSGCGDSSFGDGAALQATSPVNQAPEPSQQ